ncbi:phosphatidate cytidylyltransferase [Rhizobium halophytocola]|uniref:Phosphatidate cytidylyltransferase n=1 Tax=Rhizobium halophytocola TaxID=735519 RepID=A0ABS4DW82_9HYPH|nr:phosphatidate cytidylyltransferase [Rhizobium halophytocola]MBP1849947.1 phosphatidate cytidylyltransferase [Rhizobium halophytocola]
MSEELRLRILSSIVLIPLVLGATWLGDIAFRAISALIGLLIYYEWSTITGLADKSLRGNAWGWLSIVVVCLNLLFGSPDMTLPLLSGFVVTVLILAILGRVCGWLPGGIAYAGLSAVSLAAIRGDDAVGFSAMIFVFVIVWATDILAYFVGRAIGGPKLAPRISPGKTWSGAIGGTIAGVIGGLLVALTIFQTVSVWNVAVALLLSVSSQIGDLFESFIKRRFGVKDSSRLIPGHGGVMDRVDGLVFACFAAFFLAIIYAAIDARSVDTLGSFLFGL